MAFAPRYLPHAWKFNTTASVTAWVNQLVSFAINDGVQLFEETTGSETDRAFAATREMAGTVAATTTDLGLLTTVGFAGVPIAGAAGLTIYIRELANEGLPTAIATANHIKAVITDGLCVPVSLQASHNQAARLSLMVHAILGTGTTPIVKTASSAIASGAGQTGNLWTVGPVKYTAGSSRLVQGIQDINVEFGIQVLTESSDGEVYPSHVSIISRMTKISFTTKDASLAATVGDGVETSAFAGYFRNISSDGQRVAAATTSHVSVAGTTGMLTPDTTNLQHKQAGTSAFVYTPTLATSLITISTSAAIPTS